MNAAFLSRSFSGFRFLLLPGVLGTAVYLLQPELGADTQVSPHNVQSGAPSTSTSMMRETPGVRSKITKTKNEIVDIFAQRTWAPPPPTVVVTPFLPPQPAQPQAPPLPFRFVGRVTDTTDRTTSFVLTRGNDVVTVRVGEQVSEVYVVEEFDGNRLHFNYLPLNVRQSLTVGNVDG